MLRVAKKAALLFILFVGMGFILPGHNIVFGSTWNELVYDDFESGWGSYTSGGADCYLHTSGTHAHQGTNGATIRSNSGVASSFELTGAVDVTGYSQIKVEFWFKMVSMDDPNDDFQLQYYDGSSWQTIVSYAPTGGYTNLTYYFEEVIIDSLSYDFPADMKIRFICDADSTSDWVIIDEIRISVLPQEITWNQLTYDDFEDGWGSYTSGGADCYLHTSGTHAHQGTNGATIRSNSGVASSFELTGAVDVTGYSQIKVAFWFKMVSMDDPNDDFQLQYYNGSSWQTIVSYAPTGGYTNLTYYFEEVIIDSLSYNFPADMKIRFLCDADSTSDWVIIDEIRISAAAFDDDPREHIIFYDDCEDDWDPVDWKEVGDHNHSVYGSYHDVSVSSQYARSGNSSYRFYLKEYLIEYDLQNAAGWHKATEIRYNGPGSYDAFNFDEYWLGYSIYIPSDYQKPDKWIVHSQFHGTPDDPPTSPNDLDYCDIWRNPPLAFVVVDPNGEYHWNIHNRYDTRPCTEDKDKAFYTSSIYSGGNIITGGWNDIVIHVKWVYADDNTGILEIWINGDKKVEQLNAPNTFNDSKGPYFKIGTYGELNEAQEVVVYYDEIRIGSAEATYEDVAP